MAEGDKPRKTKPKRNMVMSTITLSPDHYRQLWLRKKYFATPMSVTIRIALNYYFEDVEELEIEDYLKQKKRL